MGINRRILSAFLLGIGLFQFSAAFAQDNNVGFTNLLVIKQSEMKAFEAATANGGPAVFDYIHKMAKDISSLVEDWDPVPSCESELYSCAPPLGEELRNIGTGLVITGSGTLAASITGASISYGWGVGGTTGLLVGGTGSLIGGAAGVIVAGSILPLIFSSYESNVTVFVANNSDYPMHLNAQDIRYGRFDYGPPKRIIPARKGGYVHVGIFSYEKKYGLFGVLGGAEFESRSTPSIKVGFGLPYRNESLRINQKSRCAVSLIPRSEESLKRFTLGQVVNKNPTSGQLLHSDSGYVDFESNRYSKISCGLSSRAHRFPLMLVSYTRGKMSKDTIERERQRQNNSDKPVKKAVEVTDRAIRPDLSTAWQSELGDIHWTSDGQYQGRFGANGNIIVGKLSGSPEKGWMYRGEWRRSQSDARGSYTFNFSQNGKSFKGSYTSGNSKKRETWNGRYQNVAIQSSDQVARNEYSVSGRSAYKVTWNAAISGHNTKQLKGVTLADCQKQCDAEKRFRCKSIDYTRDRKACDLSSKSARDVGGLKKNYKGHPYDHYARVYEVKRKAAISGHNHRRINNASVATCLKACDRESKFHCKSFDYDNKKKACDLSSKSERDVGGLKSNYNGNPYDHYSRIP